MGHDLDHFPLSHVCTQDPAEADQLIMIQRELDETKIILVSISAISMMLQIDVAILHVLLQYLHDTSMIRLGICPCPC